MQGEHAQGAGRRSASARSARRGSGGARRPAFLGAARAGGDHVGRARRAGSRPQPAACGRSGCSPAIAWSHMPNIPETLIAFLAVASIGASGRAPRPEFGPRTVVDRLAQIEPSGAHRRRLPLRAARTSTTAPSYRASSGAAQRAPRRRRAPPRSRSGRGTIPRSTGRRHGPSCGPSREAGLTFEPVPFQPSALILLSSGTTGYPRPSSTGHGGILLEHLKCWTLQIDAHLGDAASGSPRPAG